ncbi:MAG TPA: alpha/beta hydrolase [Burkholderiaceae bacterium]|nr:alpha/beta hydrolase [Burkholderiaceae bacterium]
MPTRFVDRIAFEQHGSGEAVLAIHGLGGSSNTWTPLAGDGAPLSRHTLLRLDLPGSGRSHRVEGPLSIERMVSACLRVLAAAGVERAHVLGHSLGTIVAQHLAASEPRVVRSLALFGPLPAPPDAAREAIRARGRKAAAEGAAGMAEIADALVRASTSAETRARRPTAAAFVRESLMRQDPDGYARTCEALADAVPADPARIGCPVLLVTGDEDAVAPPQSVRAMATRLAEAGVEVLRGCGHWTPVEKPDECAALLRGFLARRM